MGRTDHEAQNLVTGKWLCCVDWWLFPFTTEALSETLRRAQQVRRLPRKSTPSSLTDSLNEVRRLVGKIRQKRTDFYNAQPRWSLRDIHFDSSSEAPQVVKEFLRLAEFAAIEFSWTMNRPVRGMDWKQHAWKHTAFVKIEAITADVNAVRWLPPQLRVDQLGSIEEAQTLFRRAERGEPDAVARIDSVFPLQADKIEAAKHLFELNDEETVTIAWS
jgi:hypothetical protein